MTGFSGSEFAAAPELLTHDTADFLAFVTRPHLQRAGRTLCQRF
ncbi:hypothetical protein [Undibacterium rivi]|nr:hypothetical protein [Undibacterium rivi]